MPYIKNTYNCGRWWEVEKVFSGRYGKRTPPGEKRKPTPEEMAKINERNAEKKLRRKIARNFVAGDLHIVLTYKGEPPGKEEAASMQDKFLRTLRNWYRKQGQELKYIKVTEYKHKRIHHHIIINNIEGCLQKSRSLWKGGIYPSVMYEEGGFGDLAHYLIKETRLTVKDMDAPSRLRYSCSRNLIEPEKTTEIVKAEKWVEAPVPPQGYWIPKDSIANGISGKTGRRYQYYTLMPISSIGKEEKKNNGDKYYKPRRAPCRNTE